MQTTTAPERTGPAPADQTVRGRFDGPVWRDPDRTAARARLLIDQAAADRTRPRTRPAEAPTPDQTKPDRAQLTDAIPKPRRLRWPSAAHVGQLVYALAMVGVIALAFRLGWENTFDFAVRVLHINRTDAWMAPTTLGFCTVCAVLATVWLRRAPWYIQLYAWGLFALFLAAEVVAGVSHAVDRGYPKQAGLYSALWPLIVAAVTHLFIVVRKHVFDPAPAQTVQQQTAVAESDQTAQTRPADQTEQTPPVQTSPAEADQTPNREQTATPAVRQTAKPRTVRTKGRSRARTAKQTAAPDRPPSVRRLGPTAAQDEADRAAIRDAQTAAEQTGVPTLDFIQTAIQKAGRTCGRSKAIRLRGQLTAELDQWRGEALA